MSRAGDRCRSVADTVPEVRLFDYAASANCYKVRLLLAQLGLAYERVELDIFAGDTLTPEFHAINPARTTPVLELDDGRHLPESGAILAFLAEGTELLPRDGFDRASVLRWLLFEQSDIVPMIGGLRFRLLTGRWTRDEPEAARRRAGAREVLDILESHLQREPFLAARRYTIADVAAYGYMHVAQDADLDLKPYPAIGGWLERVRSQPGHLDDLEPYPANARPGAGRSVYG
jgi:glutathione S-transferase